MAGYKSFVSLLADGIWLKLKIHSTPQIFFSDNLDISYDPVLYLGVHFVTILVLIFFFILGPLANNSMKRTSWGKPT